MVYFGPAGYTKCIREVKDLRAYEKSLMLGQSVISSMAIVDLLSFFSELAVLEDNKDLENVLSEFQMPKMQYGTLKVAGFGETIHV